MSCTPHPMAVIFRKGVLDNREFRLKHIRNTDIYWEVDSPYGVYDCNGCFPKKRGYPYDNEGNKPPHPDDEYTFFFWRDYNTDADSSQDVDENPEWMRSIWRLFVFDGTTNCWNNSKPNYNKFIGAWNDGFLDHTKDKSRVPIACFPLNQETPTDRDRRLTYYRKHKCIWGLRNCICSESGAPCNKEENEYYYRNKPKEYDFGESDSEDSSNSEDNYEDIDEWNIEFLNNTTRNYQ